MNRCKGTDMPYKCKIFVSLSTSWGSLFCIDIHVCKISKLIGINNGKSLNMQYITGHRYEKRKNMVAKYIVHVHIIAEL